jgi:hypothetical protein
MSPEQAHETIRAPLETIFRTSRRNPETVRAYYPGQRHYGFAGESVMRAIVFIVTFVLVFGGATVVDTADNLPNAGLFVFNASPVDAPTVVASR